MATLQASIKMLKEHFEIDPDQIPERVYVNALLVGVNGYLNRGITKAKYDTTGLDGAELEAMQAKIREKVAENWEAIRADKIRIIGSSKKKSGVPKAVMTEATRMAKEQLKVLLKKHKVKISSISARDLTAAAQSYLEANPDILKKAYEIVEERENAPQTTFAGLEELIAGADVAISAAEAKKPKQRSKRAAANA